MKSVPKRDGLNMCLGQVLASFFLAFLDSCQSVGRSAARRISHYAITGTSGHISPRQHTPTPVTAQQSPDTKYTLTDTHIGPADSDSRHPSVT